MAVSLNLTHCTLTGVDASTALEDICSLSASFPLVEWGFLYSPKREGQPGRYPSITMLAEAFGALPANVRVAMHVCGDGVPHLLSGCANEIRLLELVAARRGRIQLNFNQRRQPVDLGRLVDLLKAYPETTFITQENEANLGVWEYLAQRGITNHSVLFDGSGGRGILCAEWPARLPIACGYAGGLGPDNLQVQLQHIAGVALARSTWVDMEGQLRRTDENGNDWLDLAACRACLEAVQAHLNHSHTQTQTQTVPQ
ncbi:MAG: hypothetical protein Q7V53_02905 [Caldisericota bacterium]|nr:hypothetical protein [Caldisericota bacterium]